MDEFSSTLMQRRLRGHYCARFTPKTYPLQSETDSPLRSSIRKVNAADRARLLVQTLFDTAK